MGLRPSRQFSSAREGEASILWDQVGATVGPDQREAVVATFACHQRVDRRGRAVIPDTETGPMLPRGLLAHPTARAMLRSLAPWSARSRLPRR
jgi:hypothetical protein